jgi:hypothetical protein
MVVSTFVTTMLGEFFLRHVLHTKAIDLPDYINVDHAGLKGCILGIMTNSLLQRMRGMGQTTEMLTSLVMVVATIQVALPLLFEIYGVNSKSHTSPMQKVTLPIFGL